jgi:hypothetical protein
VLVFSADGRWGGRSAAVRRASGIAPLPLLQHRNRLLFHRRAPPAWTFSAARLRLPRLCRLVLRLPFVTRVGRASAMPRNLYGGGSLPFWARADGTASNEKKARWLKRVGRGAARYAHLSAFPHIANYSLVFLQH